jgi:phosphoglycolate phosphatase
MRSVIFDLDGTLMDTSGDLLAAANVVFRMLGHGDQLVRGQDDGLAVRGGRMMLRTGLARVGIVDEALVDLHFPTFIEAYDAEIDTHTTIFPGAMEAVAALKRAGYGVGICTNKPEKQAEKLLRCMGVRGEFEALVGADTLPVRKPDPEPLRETVRRLGRDPARCCLIGDSDTDRNTARAAGVPSVLVTFGPSGDDMAALEPEALIDHFDALPDTVARLAL